MLLPLQSTASLPNLHEVIHSRRYMHLYKINYLCMAGVEERRGGQIPKSRASQSPGGSYVLTKLQNSYVWKWFAKRMSDSTQMHFQRVQLHQNGPTYDIQQ